MNDDNLCGVPLSTLLAYALSTSNIIWYYITYSPYFHSVERYVSILKTAEVMEFH